MRTVTAAAACCAAVLASTTQVVLGETLPIGRVECPDGLPDEACFEKSGGAAHLNVLSRVELPHEITVGCVCACERVCV